MAIHYRTIGLILRKTDRGEADQVLTVYTKDFGKLDISAKAIRKITSKLRSGADLFYFSEIEFIQGKKQKTLTDAIAIEKFDNTRKDLDKLKIASQIAGTFDSLVHGQEKDEELFNLLSETFNKLNNCREPVVSLVYHYFFWNLFFLLGYQVDLYNCVICQSKLFPSDLYFSVEDGGIVCGDCLGKAAKCGMISADVIKIIRLFIRKDWKILEKLKIEREHLDSLKLIAENCLSYYKRTE